jgi:excisionase family DNA binding protein
MVPEELKAHRDRLGLSQAQLAVRLGVSRVSVSCWERGATPIPRWATLALEPLHARALAEETGRGRAHSYVYLRSDARLWTVGFYRPDGVWEPESDWDDSEEAAARTAYLNGAVPNAEERPPAFRTVASLAEELGVGQDRIRLLLRSGKLRGYQVNGALWRIAQDDWEQYLASIAVPQDEPPVIEDEPEAGPARYRSLASLARELGVRPNYLRRQVRDGRLPAIAAGTNAWRVSERDWQTYLAEYEDITDTDVSRTA